MALRPELVGLPMGLGREDEILARYIEDRIDNELRQQNCYERLPDKAPEKEVWIGLVVDLPNYNVLRILTSKYLAAGWEKVEFTNVQRGAFIILTRKNVEVQNYSFYESRRGAGA